MTGLADDDHPQYATNAEAVNAAQTAGVGFLVGEVRMWAGPSNAIPSKWKLCDGAAVSRSAYSDLFVVIGVLYGSGDGLTTFNLPDFRDRSPMGARQDSGGVPQTNVSGVLTQTGGAATHTLSESEMPVHEHDMTHTHDVNARLAGVGSTALLYGLGATPSTFMTSSASFSETGGTGGGLPHSVLDPYFAIHFIIYAGQ